MLWRFFRKEGERARLKLASYCFAFTMVMSVVIWWATGPINAERPLGWLWLAGLCFVLLVISIVRGQALEQKEKERKAQARRK